MSKYRSKKTVVDGITFDSKKEATRYWQLRQLEKADRVRDLELQPRFEIDVRRLEDPLGDTYHIGFYKADFRYKETATAADHTSYWVELVEDAKGVRTPIYSLKKKLIEALYGIEIKET